MPSSADGTPASSPDLSSFTNSNLTPKKAGYQTQIDHDRCPLNFARLDARNCNVPAGGEPLDAFASSTSLGSLALLTISGSPKCNGATESNEHNGSAGSASVSLSSSPSLKHLQDDIWANMLTPISSAPEIAAAHSDSEVTPSPGLLRRKLGSLVGRVRSATVAQTDLSAPAAAAAAVPLSSTTSQLLADDGISATVPLSPAKSRTRARSSSTAAAASAASRLRKLSSGSLYRAHQSDDDIFSSGPVTRRGDVLRRSSSTSSHEGRPPSSVSTIDSGRKNSVTSLPFQDESNFMTTSPSGSYQPPTPLGTLKEVDPVSPFLAAGSDTEGISGTDIVEQLSDFYVPSSVRRGMSLLRITHKKKMQKTFLLNPETGIVSWDRNKTSSRLCVDSIFDIRIGSEATNYREELKISSEHESRWATILYTQDKKNKVKALHIVAATQKEFDSFVGVLQKLTHYRQEVMRGLAVPGETFVSVHWDKYATKLDESRNAGEATPVSPQSLLNITDPAATLSSQTVSVQTVSWTPSATFSPFPMSPSVSEDDNRRLSFEIVEKLTRRLHINCSKEYLRMVFNEADVDNSGLLDFQEFKVFVSLLKMRKEVRRIFSAINDGKDLTFDHFKTFVHETQYEEWDNEFCKKVFSKFAGSNDCLSLEAFTDVLASSYFHLCSTKPEDMTQPFSRYFISSSHNTYLVGRQVAGESSTEAYVKVLQNGCRCVEIDCWDGDSGPIVSHGRTFTSAVSFTDVIHTIHKYSFLASPYPVILSLEVHCSPENQHKMVNILTEILGEQLVREPLYSNYIALPSPEELKHKFLIKVKGQVTSEVEIANSWSTGTSTSSSFSSSTMSEFSGGDEDDFKVSTNLSNAGSSRKFRKRFMSSSSTGSSGSGSSMIRSGKQKEKPSPIVKELSDLGVYISGAKFRNFALPQSKIKNHIFSFSEVRFNKMANDSERKAALVKHNSRYLMRVYPAQYRLNSSNFDPIPVWKMGVQMAAINWQKNDISNQINNAMFVTSSASKSGYVLKPEQIGSLSTMKFMETREVSIRIISAQQLPRPKEFKDARMRLDPYVAVELFGEKEPDPITVWKTPIVENNGFNPIWNCEWKKTLKGEDYPFAFVRFSVGSGDSVFAVYTVRLCTLNRGYRHIRLHDLQGEEYIFSTLFVHIK